MDKEAAISRELAKLKKIFANIPENQRKLVEKQIANAAFMAVTLAELQEIVNRDGPVITATNGNGFECLVEHPAQKSFTNLVSKYNATIRQLADLLPTGREEKTAAAGEALAAFVAKGK